MLRINASNEVPPSPKKNFHFHPAASGDTNLAKNTTEI